MNALSGFPVGSSWRLLEPNSEAPEPVNEFAFHAPTDDPERLPTKVKQNYKETWQRPEFTGQDKDNEPRTKGEPRAVFIQEQGLTVNSKPVEWLDAFFQCTRIQIRTRRRPHTTSPRKSCASGRTRKPSSWRWVRRHDIRSSCLSRRRNLRNIFISSFGMVLIHRPRLT